MIQYDLKDYIAFITKLLECPEGEEWALFRRYDHLINAQLVEVMEQISDNLMRQGDGRSANFLHHWAKEIQQKLEQAHYLESHASQEDYDELIQALLDCPRGHENTILSQQEPLINLGLVNRMEQIAQKMAMNGNAYHAQYLMDIATQLNHKLSQSPQQQVNTGQQTNGHLIPVALNPEESELDALNPLIPEDSSKAKDVVDATKLTTELPELKLIQALAQSISKLTEAIASTAAPQKSLDYLDVLDKAQTKEWLLTTHELETILGVKPRCSASENEYHHGGWRFIKSGKIGRDLLWQVLKFNPAEVKNSSLSTIAPIESSFSGAEIEPDPW